MKYTYILPQNCRQLRVRSPLDNVEDKISLETKLNKLCLAVKLNNLSLARKWYRKQRIPCNKTNKNTPCYKTVDNIPTDIKNLDDPVFAVKLDKIPGTGTFSSKLQ